MSSGTRLRLQGEGEAGLYGGPGGDLYILIFVEEHPMFQRDGNDLFLDLPISFSQAALGTEIKITTLYGDEKLKIPSGTQPGTIFRMRGKGIPEVGTSSRGDQYVRVHIEVPKKLSRDQKKLLDTVDKSFSTATKKTQEKIFQKIKDSIQDFHKSL